MGFDWSLFTQLRLIKGKEDALRVWKLSTSADEGSMSDQAGPSSGSSSDTSSIAYQLVEHGKIDRGQHSFRALRMIDDELVTAGTEEITIYGASLGTVLPHLGSADQSRLRRIFFERQVHHPGGTWRPLCRDCEWKGQVTERPILTDARDGDWYAVRRI